ncbi:stalk domain-containing protein [Clostridium formicaceticum]|uniref:Intracellular proteinase inhibitor n=1 Tax=Clostridium formicaceticum TaxID=1497 RepID=A0AAC9RKJ9_9CLOT|nr:stalk domain-containing protein [Clostridium formicaceticum]AOY74579.1 hypothetical protein BJL90_00580 [Clostridium formicaceticum]ARE88941.1 Intracellular proteinase inhibitor [Clostridium formicaceticum]
MIKSKLIKTLTLGICFTALSSNMVLANGGVQPSILPSDMIEIDLNQVIDMKRLPVDLLDTSVSDLRQEPREISGEMIQKQKEIDRYLFKDHVKEIEKKGFAVTYTGAFDDYVEIGITPYNEESAQYLYGIFGKDQVKIVEGQQASILPIEIDAIDIGVIHVSESTLELKSQRIKEDSGVKIQVNGEFLQLDVEPFIENDRTLIPLRGVMEKLGAKVEWYPEESTVKIYAEDIRIELVIGEDTAKITKNIDGELKEERIKLGVKAKIVGGRTFIPGRFVTETLGAKVDWDNSSRVMMIESSNISDIDSEGLPIAEGKFETKGSYVIKDDKVVFDFELMSHYTEPKELQFGSGQQFEIVIVNEEDEEVYRYSDDKFFTLALIFKNINPGEAIKWQDEWDMTNKEGEKLTSGKYQAKINVLVIEEEKKEKIEKSQLTTIIDFSL